MVIDSVLKCIMDKLLKIWFNKILASGSKNCVLSIKDKYVDELYDS